MSEGDEERGIDLLKRKVSIPSPTDGNAEGNDKGSNFQADAFNSVNVLNDTDEHQNKIEESMEKNCREQYLEESNKRGERRE